MKHEDVYPLTPMQMGLFAASLGGQNDRDVYVEQISCIITGRLDIDAFRAAWQAVVKRHSTLRTAFIWEGLKQPLQVVWRDVKVTAVIESIESLPSDEQDLFVKNLLRSERERGFVLSSPPLFRLVLVKVADDVYRLVFSFHHLILDGWSISLVLQEILAHYAAASSKKTLNVSSSQPFRKYVEWVHTRDCDAARKYWEKALLGVDEPLRFWRSKPRDTLNSSGMASETVELMLSQKTTADLTAWARARQLTVNTLLQGVWAILLSRYAQTSDVLFGMVISGRSVDLNGIEGMIGLLINILPVRIEVNARQDLIVWLKDLQLQHLERLEFAQSSLQDIQSWCGRAGKPLFFTLLNYHSEASGRNAATLEEIQIGEIESVAETKYAITLLARGGERLSFLSNYDSRLIGRPAMRRLLDRMSILLERFLYSEDRAVESLSVMTPAEREQVAEWNRTEYFFESFNSIAELFERQVQLTPEQTVLLFNDERLSYRELNERANQLAHYLRFLGVGPERCVALCFHRNIEMIVGILGILKSGAAYLPLDPRHPADRIGFMLEDAQAPVLLTETRLRDAMPVHWCQVVCLDEMWDEIAHESSQNPPPVLQPHNLAYVIYTSGSTGQPKGVAVEHRQILNYIAAILLKIEISNPSFALLSSVAADLGHTALFPGFCGGCLHVLPSEWATDADQLAKFFRDHDVDVIKITPSHLNALLASSNDVLPKKLVVLGGEALSWSTVSKIRSHSQCKILNHYGPTECTVGALTCPLNDSAADIPETVPIGSCIANVQAYVLDDHLELTPAGIAGELYIAGDGLARGYLNRPDFSAERFIPNPFAVSSGSRMYRTGDRARWLEDGNVEFLGRWDDQVKIRGYRIELGEIEAVLNGHSGIMQSAVAVYQDSDQEKRLVAYIAGVRATRKTSELKEYLKRKLPDYMVPSVFVEMQELPLTANGKVDRKMLPAPEHTANSDGKAYPRNPAEEILAGMWKDLLEVDDVGIHDSFFDLGGHSLLATQLVSRMREAFEAEVSLQSVFDSPSIAELAQRIDTARNHLHSLTPPLERRKPGTAAPLSFAQQRLWFHHQLQPESKAYNIPTGLRLKGKFQVEYFDRAVRELVCRHEVLKTRFNVEDDGEPAQQIQEDWQPNVDVVDIGVLSPEAMSLEVERYAANEATTPFDICTGPVMRVKVLRLSDDQHVLLITMHHIASDAWSAGILVKEITVLYESFSQGLPSPLPELKIQYADFAFWQRNWLKGDVLREQLDYWRGHLEGMPPLELPVDRKRSDEAEHPGAIVSLAMNTELTHELRLLSRREGSTLFMTLLAGLQLVLGRWARRQDVATGTVVANRNRVETESLIGFFVNTLVMRGNLAKDPTFFEFLARTREAALGAYAHQDLPFERLVEELQPQRDLGRHPLVDVMFALQNTPVSQTTIESLEVTLLPEQEPTAKFDITVVVSETESGLAGTCVYDAHLYERSTIERLLGHWRQVLEQVRRDPTFRVGDFEVVTAVERAQILSSWNHPHTANINPVCVHELFTTQANLTPNAIAVSQEHRQLRFGELNSRSNQLAHYLRGLGVTPEVRVGLCTTRSLEMIVGLLGILKAGGTYLPLDPSHPAERLSEILEDAQCAVVLIESGLLNSLPAYWAQIVSLDTEWAEIEKQSSENPETRVSSENAAYVIYTSGSTGQPKGVVVEHRSVANYLHWCNQEYSMEVAWQAPVHTPLIFDLTVTSIFLPLICGQRITMVQPGPGTSSLNTTLQGSQLPCIVKLTPAHLQMLASAPSQTAANVACLVVGGEALEPSTVRVWQAQAPQAKIFNEYGPTEATVGCCVYEVEHDFTGNVVPIGRPIFQTQIYILDGSMQLCPAMVPGEIYIGGAGLARGYLGRPDLTAEKFVPDPFGEPGMRLYQSGDLGRFRSDGVLEFMGRVDEQVKIRGYRIEKGEIEAVLRRHLLVQQAVVTTTQDPSGGRRLVAYFSVEAAPPSASPYLLPNGASIFQLSANETSLLYEEIFDNACYTPREIHLAEDACILDVGANIGLFTLLTGLDHPQRKIYAFEPLPPIYSVLKKNVSQCRAKVTALPFGLSNAEEKSDFLYRRSYPAMSRQCDIATLDQDLKLNRRALQSAQERGVEAAADWLEENDFLREKLQGEVYGCRLKPLSQVIKEEQIERVDLLKIDVERMELHVLRGIAAEDWPKIKQVVAEIHDDTFSECSLLQATLEMLRSNGFEVRVEENALHRHTEQYNIFARRKDLAGDRISHSSVPLRKTRNGMIPGLVTASRVADILREYARSKLPGYMVPDVFMQLDCLPLTQNGKINRAALPSLGEAPVGFNEKHVEPRTGTEQALVEIWMEVLGRKGIGVHDSFFELGGHSLLATQAISRVKTIFGVELPLRVLFETPTIAQIGAVLEEIWHGGSRQPESIPVVQNRDELPLSYSQQRLWFIDQLVPGTISYNISEAVRMEGALDVGVLERGLREIGRRHESLRTRFTTVRGEPRQVVDAEFHLDFSTIDLSSMPDGNREAEARRMAVLDSETPFNLRQAPLLRVKLLRLAEANHVLLLTIHHIISDGWSLEILIREMSVLYAAYSGGRPSPLPELPIQYADFSVWQRKWMSGAVLDEELRYWRNQLAGLSVLTLPACRPRPAVQSQRGAMLRSTSSAQLSQGLKELCRRNGVTLYMALLAVFQSLLYRWSGQPDIAVGSPVAGRTRMETEGLIGFFLNMLVLRTNLSGGPTFPQLLQRVKSVALDAYSHQHVPFEKLVDALQPERDMSRTPLFQAAFVFQSASMPIVNLGPVRLSAFDVDSNSGKFDLMLGVSEENAGLQVVLQYGSDLFDESTVAGMQRSFHVLLDRIVIGPTVRIEEMPLLSDEESGELTFSWMGPAIEAAMQPTVSRVVEANAQSRPEAPVVVSRSLTLTYGELNLRANNVAAYLLGLGLRNDARVGLCLDGAADLLTAALGIWRIGAAFVPLNPAEPAMRLGYLLDDSGAAVVIVAPEYEDRFQSLDVRVIVLERIPVGASDKSMAEDHCMGVDTLGCVLYRPHFKGGSLGLLIPQAAFVSPMLEGAKLTATDRVGIPVDFERETGCFGLFAAVTAGACVVDLASMQNLPPRQISGFLREHGVTVLWMVGAFMVRAVRGFLRNLKEIRLVLSDHGSEGLNDLYQTSNRSLLSHTYGVYGGSELASGYVRYSPVRVGARGNIMPMESVVAGTSVYLLDACLNPLPDGAIGEIYVSRQSLMWGYHCDPALTAERFLPDPFSHEEGSRLYRTGDLAYRRSDGCLEFCGRNDRREVIDACRIEPEEIEVLLRAYPGICDAAVAVSVTDNSSSGVLEAILATEAETPVETSRLNQFLLERLPVRMLPVKFVTVDSIPKDANGKVIHNAVTRLLREKKYVPPTNQVEDILARIWARLLNVEQVGLYDNFFELGGDSILSIQVIAHAREAGIHLTPRQMFERQTVAALAEVAVSVAPAGVEPERISGSVPLTPIQEAFFRSGLVNPAHFNQSVLLQLNPGVDSSALESAMMELLRHHDALRMSFRPGEKGWEQSCEAAEPQNVYQRIDYGQLSKEAQGTALEQHANQVQGSLDLSSGCMVKVVEYNLGADRGRRLLLVIHHLVVDGVSWRILLQDLEYVYKQLESGIIVSFPAKTASYRAWAEKIRLYSTRDDIDSEIEYWSDQAKAAVKRLPRDYETKEEENTIATEQSVSVSLDEGQTASLLQAVPRAYRARINDVLLTALVRICAEWTGTSRVLIEVESHGREPIYDDIDVSRTVGWFTSSYPLLLDVGDSWAPGKTLKRVKEQIRALPNHGFGYGVLSYFSDDIGLRKRLEAGAHPEISFNYLGQIDQTFQDSTLFSVAHESRGNTRMTGERRTYVLDVGGMVIGGRLQVSWTFSEKLHRRETIERLAASYAGCLREIAAHCESETAFGYTPSDFPLAKLTQDYLDFRMGGERDIEDIYPLSPMQQGMLFHTIDDPTSGVYFNQSAYVFGDVLDVPTFKHSWQAAVERHPVLRTRFLWEGLKHPLQVVKRYVDVPWVEQDWSGLDEVTMEEQWRRFLREDRERGFDFHVAPLLRLTLIRTTGSETRFVWSSHHIVIDGWCRQILINEIFSTYEAVVEGRQLSLPRPAPYSAYIAWLGKQDQTKAEIFWREELEGFLSANRLWIRQVETPVETSEEFVTAGLQLSGDLTQALESTARRQQVTMNTVAQAAWALTLSYYTGETDVVFGATVSGRSAEITGIQSLVGLFINTLPVRVRLEGSENVASCLQRLQHRQAEARLYEYTPLAKVQEWSGVPRGSRLFETVLVFGNYPVNMELRQKAGSTLQVGSVDSFAATNYPLILQIFARSELRLNIVYRKRQFASADVARLLEHLSQILSGMVKPDKRIDEIDILSNREKSQLLLDWNSTKTDYSSDKCIHEVFESQVQTDPDAIAVNFAGVELTYEQLNRQSNQLAGFLRDLGVGPETKVGLCIERSLELIVAVFAVLKAGGAYVPLDPALPVERLEYMVADTMAPLILVGKDVSRQVRFRSGKTIRMDEVSGTVAQYGEGNTACRASSRNLAYVLYTSGSTGKPKGVTVEHSRLVNYTFAMTRRIGIPRCSFAMVQPLSADSSLTALFLPLFCGGCVFMVSRDCSMDAQEIARLFSDHRVDGLKIAPSHLAALRGNVKEDERRIMPHKVLVIGGEASHWSWMRSLQSSAPECLVFNHYGPTESTVGVLTYRLGEGPERSYQTTPLGKPLDNTEIYILNRWMKPVPPGAAGELYVSGDCLARGYLSNADKTAEKFLPNPFTREPGQRMYQTGDLARYVEDGYVEFLGRVDNQIKIHGYRIEPAEIEMCLLEHSAIEQAVVITRRNEATGNQQLVAYVVVRQGRADINLNEMRRHLTERLPDYMLPAAIMKLDALPRSAHGKLDTGKLPAPESAGNQHDGYVAPRNRTEEILSEVWADLLGVERIGIHSNFFELGGDSILIIQAVARARDAGVQLHTRHMIERQTIAELSEIVSGAKEVRAAQGFVHGLVPLTPIQAAFFHDWNLARPSHFNQSLMLTLSPGVNSALLKKAVEELLKHHDALRMKYIHGDSGWKQWCEADVSMEIFARRDLTGFDAATRRTEMENDAAALQASLDLESGSIVRFVEYDMGEEYGRRLLIVIHHLVVDGVSWRILLEDLDRGYRQLAQTGEVGLGRKTTSFREWSEELVHYAGQKQLLEELTYWRGELSREVTPLPRDFDVGTEGNLVGTQQTVTVEMNEAETRALLREVPKAYQSQINDVLLAVLGRVCADWSGSTSISIDLEGHGRNEFEDDLDLSRTVGWFTTIYPVVIEVGDAWEPGRALIGALQQIRRVPNGGFGYGVLRYLGDLFVRDRMPAAAEIKFNYLGQTDQVLRTSQYFAFAPEGTGSGQAAENLRRYALDVNALITAGKLQIGWTCSHNLFRRETIEAVAQRYLGFLRELITHCVSRKAGDYVPSDFPLANLQEEDLAQIASLLDQ